VQGARERTRGIGAESGPDDLTFEGFGESVEEGGLPAAVRSDDSAPPAVAGEGRRHVNQPPAVGETVVEGVDAVAREGVVGGPSGHGPGFVEPRRRPKLTE